MFGAPGRPLRCDIEMTVLLGRVARGAMTVTDSLLKRGCAMPLSERCAMKPMFGGIWYRAVRRRPGRERCRESRQVCVTFLRRRSGRENVICLACFPWVVLHVADWSGSVRACILGRMSY